MKLPGRMRLKEARRVPMWNGPIECRLFRFDLVAGSMRGAERRARRLHARPAPPRRAAQRESKRRSSSPMSSMPGDAVAAGRPRPGRASGLRG